MVESSLYMLIFKGFIVSEFASIRMRGVWKKIKAPQAGLPQGEIMEETGNRMFVCALTFAASKLSARQLGSLLRINRAVEIGRITVVAVHRARQNTTRTRIGEATPGQL